VACNTVGYLAVNMWTQWKFRFYKRLGIY